VADAVIEPADGGDGSLMQAMLPNQTQSAAFYQVTLAPPAAIFFDDFESGAPGWTVEPAATVTQWELGAPVRSEDPPVNAPDAAYSGANVWGTDLNDNYEEAVELILRSPVIDLSGYDNAYLTFWNYREMEPFDGDFWDWAAVNLLDESNNLLVELPLLQKAGQTAGWEQEFLQLPFEAMGKRIRLEFYFISDSYQPDNIGMAGWYIDDVAVLP
jgi:hypothetical protein